MTTELDRLCETSGITIESRLVTCLDPKDEKVSIGINGNPERKQWTLKPGHWVWQVTLINGSKRLETRFTMGSAHCKQERVPCREPYIYIPNEPTVADVLYCLLADAGCAEDGFEDFCGNCGYDTDSRKAEAIWRSCLEVYPRLRVFLGERFDEFRAAEH